MAGALRNLMSSNRIESQTNRTSTADICLWVWEKGFKLLRMSIIFVHSRLSSMLEQSVWKRFCPRRNALFYAEFPQVTGTDLKRIHHSTN
eukprot:6457530-Amphidinium_carterae.1